MDDNVVGKRSRERKTIKNKCRHKLFKIFANFIFAYINNGSCG